MEGSKLAEVGLTALFANRLWYSADHVEEFMDGIKILAPLMTKAQMVKLSGSFWALAGREGGDTIVSQWMQTLKGDSAKVMLSDSFWSLYISTSCSVMSCQAMRSECRP